MEWREEIAGEKGGACFCAHLARRNVESLEGHGCTKHTVAIKNLLDHVFQCKTAADERVLRDAYPTRSQV